MKINNVSGIINTYNLNNKKTKRETNLDGTQREDKTEISQRAKDIAAAQKALAASGDVRTEKVQAIKEQIEQGTYTIDPVKIAQKMLSRN